MQAACNVATMPQQRQRTRGVNYPGLFTARRIAKEVERFPSQASAALYLGIDKTTFNKWTTGRTLPASTEAWAALERLGIPAEELRTCELLDKLDAWRIDEDQSARELLITAMEMAAASGEDVLEVARRMQRLGKTRRQS